MNDVALVTGASSGIGAELARQHAAHGGSLVLVARREERLRSLLDDLRDSYGTDGVVIAMDLAGAGAARELFDRLEARGIVVDILVNNAGFGGWGPFSGRPWVDDDAMIRLNVMALTELSRLFLPGMIDRGRGRILNVASVAGFVPGPLQAVYYATKAYVLSLSEALAVEISTSGVTVTALCPGPTASEFMDRAHMEGVRLFRFGAATASSVARAGYRGMLKGRPVVVPGLANKILVQSLRVSPRALVRRLSGALMGK